LIGFRFLNFLEDQIDEVEARMRAQSEGHNPELESALEHLLQSGGKRVRPILVLLMGAVLGGEQDAMVTLGAAVELLHTATLVHDDLIDGSLLRRGNPTLNANWSSTATVLTGDYIFSRAASLAADLNSPAVLKIFADTLSTVVNGEVRQLFERQSMSTREAYFKRIYDKTASMFVLATKAAAVLSSRGEAEIENARIYGHQLGMAFQIVDDILDFTGDQETVGKPVGSDLRQGIITLPVIRYQELYPDNGAVQLVFESTIEEDRLDELIEDIRDSRAISAAKEEAEAFVERAIQALEELPEGQEREALRELALYVVSRER
jgi:geranylgeranyl pyrophosphate synthase